MIFIIAVNNVKVTTAKKNNNGNAIHIPIVLNIQKSAIVKSKGIGHESTFITRACAELPKVKKNKSKIYLFILFLIMELI